MRTEFSLAIVGTLLVAAGADAQTHMLKIRGNPAAGKSMSVSESAKVNIAFSVSLDNNVLMEDKKQAEDAKEYTEKVIETGDKGPTKFTRTYKKAVKGDAGDVNKLSYEGKTILFERKGDRFEATSQSGDVEEKDLKDLLKNVNNKARDNGALTPKNAVKVGESWTLTKESLGSFIGDLKEGADFDKFKGSGKLLKVYTKDGQEWGSLEIALSVPIRKFGPLDLEKAIPFEMKLTMDTPIDGSSTANQVKGTVVVRGKSQVEQNGQTIMLDIDVAAVVDRRQSAEK
jgi:hypothetical protein